MEYTKEDDFTPQQAQTEYIELLVKSGRRCAYDLRHAADCIPYGDQFHQIFSDSADRWLTVFNPGNDKKNYRHHLYQVIADLENKIEKLRKRCEDNNIDIIDLHLYDDLF